jgi:hypothetical protein
MKPSQTTNGFPKIWKNFPIPRWTSDNERANIHKSMQKKTALTLSGNAQFNDLLYWLHLFFGFLRNTPLALLLPTV